jgi:ubiquinol-cytochrome c reductase cytochrome c1 subunit
MKTILALLLLLPSLAWSAEEGPPLDHAPVDLNNKASLQHGAQIFVNNCLSCHTASLMRYGRLEDLGLTEQQIKENLLFGEKIGDPMAPPVDPKISKAAFSVVPPDLTLIARSRSPDWLYTYLRGFYRDASTKTGWNNIVFPNVAMPNVLWRQQGQQSLEVKQRQDQFTGDVVLSHRLVLDRPGALAPLDYDRYVGDLVNYLTWMSEPAQVSRRMWGVLVLFFFTGFFVLTLLLKKEYWKDVH